MSDKPSNRGSAQLRDYRHHGPKLAGTIGCLGGVVLLIVGATAGNNGLSAIGTLAAVVGFVLFVVGRIRE